MHKNEQSRLIIGCQISPQPTETLVRIQRFDMLEDDMSGLGLAKVKSPEAGAFDLTKLVPLGD